jgi:DNA repair photolyase
MNQESTWINTQTIGEDEHTANQVYQYFMRPEPFEDLGPIYTVNDPYLGVTKARELKIGMIRNAKEENKKTVTAFLYPYPHTRIDKAKQLQGWYKGLHEPEGVRPRPCFTEAILTEPYGGWCAVGCAFCYINSGFRGYRGTGLITVPINYGEQIQKQLSKMKRGAAGYFSSFTDPFTPLENYYHNTENAAREFVKVGLPVFFLSRLKYPDWAIDILKQNKHSYAQKSINTSNRDDWNKLSPGAISYDDHLADITRLRKAGIYVSIQVNPIIAGITTHGHIRQLFKDLAKAGANHVIVKFVEAGYSWAPTMEERMRKRFGEERAYIFKNLFTENIGGQRTITEAYRLNAHDMYSRWAKQDGMTYATCYEYKYLRDGLGHVIDKTGVSIGREYTTSSQCHGQAVPVYSRDDLGQRFEPLEECPPSGCLYCASENQGQARCGDELAGQANALKLADMKLGIGEGKSRSISLNVLEE